MIEDRNGMLDLVIQPAFSVENGKISYINAAGTSQLLESGTDITELLMTGQEEYAALHDGTLYLTLRINGRPCGASVRRMGDMDVFILEQCINQTELQAMALAAKELRQPLSNVMTITDQLFPASAKDADSDTKEQMARINRGLYQMLRILGNMSDAYRYSKASSAVQQTRNVCTMLRELLTSYKDLIQHTQIELNYTVPSQPIYCLVDEEKLERAVSNILSNAIKFSQPGDTIHVTLMRKGTLLYLSVQDNGNGIAPNLRGNIYSRYLREPGIEDNRYGLGLGMVLIRSAATVHGGTVLIQQPEEAGTKITMTLKLRQSKEAMLRSPIHRIDYAGEHDHKLIELSESLPSSVYKIEHIN